MKWITPRELRKNKGLYVLRKSKNNIYIASQMLGNTPDTFKKHYSEGSLKDTVFEFEALWNSIRKKELSDIRHKNIPPKPVIALDTNNQFNDIPVGSCLDFKKPKKSLEFNDKAINPTCLRAEGCLFCNNFAIHSTKDDVHKILSCQFVLKSLRPVFDDEDHFLSEYGVIISRIDEVLEQISEKGLKEKNLVTQTKEEVYQKGKLNNYWNRRLNMLIEMKVDLEFN